MPRKAINIPDKLHPATQDLVVRFAEALAAKLLKSQKKHGFTTNWKETDWQQKCSHDLLTHVRKGDPLDVAAYCAFMWHHNWPTSLTCTIIIHPEE